MFNWFQHETLLRVIHHPEFLSVLPFGDAILGLGAASRFGIVLGSGTCCPAGLNCCPTSTKPMKTQCCAKKNNCVRENAMEPGHDVRF